MSTVDWATVQQVLGDRLAALRAAGYDVVPREVAVAAARDAAEGQALVSALHRVVVLLSQHQPAPSGVEVAAQRCPVPGCGWQQAVWVCGGDAIQRQDAAWWAGVLWREHLATAHGMQGGEQA